MYLWTCGIDLNPRGGLVVLDQNNNLKGSKLLIQPLNCAQMFTGVFKCHFPFNSYYIAMRTIESLNIKNLADTP